MYNPLALDHQRMEQERLRRRIETAPRWPEPATSTGDEPVGRFHRLRRSHRRPATAC